LASQGFLEPIVPKYFSVKEAVFPFNKFQGVDPVLGPEMKSTGEVMGVGRSFAEAYFKSQLAAGNDLHSSGNAFISVREVDRPNAVEVAKSLAKIGFKIKATDGTAGALVAAGVECEIVNKVTQGRPHIVDQIINGDIDLIVNTTEGKQSLADSFTIRREALNNRVAYVTTMAAALATCEALGYEEDIEVYRLQNLHEEIQS
jgi:carbamoyl-phosphate synthase large subunit